MATFMLPLSILCPVTAKKPRQTSPFFCFPPWVARKQRSCGHFDFDFSAMLGPGNEDTGYAGSFISPSFAMNKNGSVMWHLDCT